MTLVTVSGPHQQVAMPAIDLRRSLLALIGSEGVRASGDYLVSQRGAGANMSVDVSGGLACIIGDAVAGQGVYTCFNDAVINVAIGAAHATLPRVDRVCLRVRDAFHGDAANDFALVVLPGTATSGATLTNLLGGANVPNNHLLLANVLAAGGAVSVTNAQIDSSVRTLLRPTNSLAPGISLTYRGTVVPTGHLPEDGAAISRSSYPGVFGAVGTVYGVGDGVSTFNLPDSRGRVDVGLGTHADVNAVGKNEGVAVGTRSIRHKHTKAGGAYLTGNVGFADGYHEHGGNSGREVVSLTPGGTGYAIVGNQASQDVGVDIHHAWAGVAVNNGSLGAADSITIGPQGGEPTDAPGYLVALKMITI